MKRLAIFILMLCCLISLFSCVNSEIDIPEDTKLNIENNDENHWESNDSPDSVNTSIETEGKENEAIGGTHMGDDLYSPYNGYVDTIIYKKGTFSENYAQYMTEFDEMEGEWDYNRPALMYYLVCEMNLTRDDLETYYAALGYEDVPEYVYAGLLADTLEESMQLLKTEYAFYDNGKLYTIYDVYEMQEDQTLTFDITDVAYDSVWESINTYQNSEYAYDVEENITQFVSQKGDEVK